MLNSRIKPFELSLWKEKLIQVPQTSLNNNPINIYNGLETNAEDLNFWYFERNWKETYLEPSSAQGANHQVMLIMGKPDGADSNIKSNFSTTILNFKPNTTYTVILEMDFTDGNTPFWNNYKVMNSSSENFDIVDLVRSTGAEDNENFKTIFDSDIVLSFNDAGFNINNSNFSGEDEALLFQENSTIPSKILCVCSLKTNDFLNEKHTIGLWTTFNCFKFGYWKSLVRIRVVEEEKNQDNGIYNSLKMSQEAQDSNYVQRINEKENQGLLNGETILEVFKEKIREVIYSNPNSSNFSDLVNENDKIDYYKIPKNILDSFFEELFNLYDKYDDILTNTSDILKQDIFRIFNKYFPFIPTYGTTDRTDMGKIKLLDNGAFGSVFDNIINHIKGNILGIQEVTETAIKNALNIDIMTYINLILKNATTTEIVDGNTKIRMNTEAQYETLLLQLFVFFLNNNTILKYVYNSIYKQIDSNIRQDNRSPSLQPLETYTLNKINTAIYIMEALLVINDIYDDGVGPNTKNGIFPYVSNNLISQITLNPVVIENNTFKVTGNFGITSKGTYILTKIIYTGWPAFGFYTNPSDNTVANYIGFIPWLNNINDSAQSGNFKNSISFHEIIKLYGQNITVDSLPLVQNTDDFFEENYYLKDYKVFVFGSNEMSELSAAQEIQLKTSAKEVSTLTFSLFDRYFDTDAQKFVKNEFIPYLKNESKLRLYYDNKWYDFTIVNIQEDLLVSHKINYTAKDSNILELSKIGFNKTFNTELDNNIGTINELTNKVLENLTWKLDEDRTEFIQQLTEQPFFMGTVKTNFSLDTIGSLENLNDSTISHTITSGSIICLFYNEVLEELREKGNMEDGNYLHILTFKETPANYSEAIEKNSTNNILDIDKINYYTLKNVKENNTIIDNWEYNEINNKSYKIPSFLEDGLDEYQLFFANRAEQLICKPKMHYSKPLKRYVYEYEYENSNVQDEFNGKIYYGYEKTEYTTNSLITNLLPSGQNFINLNNWYVINTPDNMDSALDLGITNNNSLIEVTSGETTTTDVAVFDNNYSFLSLKTRYNTQNQSEYGKEHGFFLNTDLTFSYDDLNSLTVGDKFALRLQIERGIDKSYTSISGTVYQDDQITLLQSLVPYIYTYPSVEKVQNENFSIITEKDQLINFWYPTQHEQNGKIIEGLSGRAQSGRLVPVYWNPAQAGFTSEDNKKGLPVFYTYEENIKKWHDRTGGSLIGWGEDQSSTYANLQNKVYYLTLKGAVGLWYFITKKLRGQYISPQNDFFDYHDFPIISPLFKDGVIDILYQSSIQPTETTWLYGIFKKNTANNYFYWRDTFGTAPISSIEDKISYYITYNLNSLEEYKEYFYPDPGDEEKITTLEQYIYNKDTNCFEPQNIMIKGVNDGDSTIAGLPWESSMYYNDFDILMCSRAVWKPIQYQPNGTCIFEAVGAYKGKPNYQNNSYRFEEINYNRGDLLSKNIGLFFLVRPTKYDGSGTSTWNVKNSFVQLAVSKVEFFRKYEDENGNTISPQDILDATTKTLYCLYDPEIVQNSTALVEDDLTWAYKEYYLDEKYKKVIDYTGEKNNSITITESNVYNILQKLAEIFDVWLNIDIEHENSGELSLNENYQPIKRIYYTNSNYNNNFAGIKYGINLKNIQRQIDSNDIINKLIVKNNSNEYGKLGFCSIMNSDLNISGSNSIYNFDYYTNNGIIDANEMYKLLYEEIYPKTYVFGRILTDIAEKKSKQKVKITQVQSEVDFYKVGCDNISDQISEKSGRFYALTGYDYAYYLANPNINQSTNPLYVYQDNLQFLTYITQLEYYNKLFTTYKNNLSYNEQQLSKLQNEYLANEQQKNSLIYQRDYLLDKIYKIYSSYVKEGSWISEDYIDDDLYYIDGEKKLQEASQPKVSYTIEIVDISSLPDYSSYTFNLRDKTYIEDPEIFGYSDNGIPYREEIIVTELTNYLQSPEKNTITVQNYKNQFNDLFQRMASTIQAVEFGTGNYSNLNNSLLKNRILNNDI